MKATFIISAMAVAAIVVAVISAGNEDDVVPIVEFQWGIPEDVQAIDGAVTRPQGEEVTLVNKDHLYLTWEEGESYVLPFSAYSETELKGVRYLGSGIPAEFQLEWKDPWEEEWYPFELLPQDKIKAEITEEEGLLNIDFGPPGGADFEEGLTRLAWFRITPTEPTSFDLKVLGKVENEEEKNRVTNILTAEISVE